MAHGIPEPLRMLSLANKKPLVVEQGTHIDYPGMSSPDHKDLSVPLTGDQFFIPTNREYSNSDPNGCH